MSGTETGHDQKGSGQPKHSSTRFGRRITITQITTLMASTQIDYLSALMCKTNNKANVLFSEIEQQKVLGS